MYSSFHSQALGKAFVFGWIACPMHSSPTPLGWCLCEILSKMLVAIVALQKFGEGEVKDIDGDILLNY
jgi:hypothetical protein